MYGILLSRLGWCYKVLNLLDSYKDKDAGLLVLHLLLRLNPWFIVEMWPASLSFFCRQYYGRCSSELAHLVPFPFSRERSRYSDRLHDFSVTISRYYKDVYVNSFFPLTAGLWNSLAIECFPLTYNLNCFKSRINRHLLNVCSF